MGWRLKTAASNENADVLADLKAFMRVSESAEDDLITFLLKSAVRQIENFTRLHLLTQVWELSLDRPLGYNMQRSPWWNGTREGSVNEYFYAHDYIDLNRTPVASIVSFKYFSPDNTENTFTNAAYRLDTTNVPNRIVLNEGYTWPTNVRDRDAFLIEVSLGYGADQDALPEDIRNAIRSQVMWLYDNRTCGEMKLTDNVMAMLEPYVQMYR